MWPWGHLALGYACYSGYTRIRHGRPPSTPAVWTLALATQLPDLVDKPLAWGLGVLPSGLSLGHSLLFAIPLSLAALALARRRSGEHGAAVVVGYLSHLAGDVAYQSLGEGELVAGFLLWPLISRPERSFSGLLAETRRLFRSFVEAASSPGGAATVAPELGLLLAVLFLWGLDGFPGIPDSVRRDPR